MTELNRVLSEIGISKVKLAKYLGVSRQMIYNYLELDSLSKWPQEKRLLLLKLLDIEDEGSLKSIKVTSEYLENFEMRLNQNVKDINSNMFNYKNLTKEEQELLNDTIFLIKEKFTEDKKKDTYYTFLYLYHVLQSLDNVPEIKYILGYLSKKTGFTNPNEFKFDENKQFILESIIYTAFNLYNNGGASRSRLEDSHNRFVQEIEQEKEEKLSRTQQLNTIRVQALKELGYTELNTHNATEVFNKIAEIESRKV
ncbi:MAG: hypothetical protein IJB83_03185 [Bacilli bacterium]|nr:hypothetical protein [Bacilli bacterium]